MQEHSNERVTPDGFRNLVKDIPFAMFTTVTADGSMRSRPMVALTNAFDGSLWFVTRATSAVASELGANGHVNAAYVSAPEDRFVSVSGTATVVRDVEAATRLWAPAFNQWFAGGPTDSDLALLKIDVSRVDYWDAVSGRMEQL